MTKDKRIRTNIVELDKLVKCKVKAISLAAGDFTGSKIAEMFISHRLQIGRFLKNNTAPFLAYLNKKWHSNIRLHSLI